MIKYTCDECHKDIQPNEETELTIKSPGHKRRFIHLCTSCAKPAINWLMPIDTNKNVESEEKVANDKSTDIVLPDCLSTLRRGYPDRVPRTASLIRIRRALLLIYQGLVFSDISAVFPYSYTELYNIRKKYAFYDIAERHYMPERNDEKVSNIIKSYINSTEDLTCSVYDINEKELEDIIYYYTGIKGESIIEQED